MAARGARDDLRRTMANGVRMISLLLIPSAVLMAVLAEPITRLVYQRGAFGPEATDLHLDGAGLVVDLAALPGREPAVLAHVLLAPAALGDHGPGRLNLVVNAALAAALYAPLEITGIVLGTVAGTIMMCFAQGWILRDKLDGIEGRLLLSTLLDARRRRSDRRGGLRGLVRTRRAAGPLARRSARAVLAALAPARVYAALVWALRVPEARQIRRLLVSRGRHEGKAAHAQRRRWMSRSRSSASTRRCASSTARCSTTRSSPGA